ncbi:hypothetical protein A0H81_10993 [Grifola frondosa]|uniref:Uncharacterized protein n=1 Tax=Grifola frondosa TaxID=5627 RepID=A0A1C7LVM9_GRIFR|nr:hypothetical protein A0H81_10993 [Grifola frondosa]
MPTSHLRQAAGGAGGHAGSSMKRMSGFEGGSIEFELRIILLGGTSGEGIKHSNAPFGRGSCGIIIDADTKHLGTSFGSGVWSWRSALYAGVATQ